MPTKPLISVIVPIYRAETYLPRCVASILEQTYSRLELVLIDDGSPDGCPDLCDAYVKSDPRVIAVHQKNNGVSAARNIGLITAHGEYITFVDADDWVEPDYLSYLFNLVEKTGVSLAACNHYVFANDKDYVKFPSCGKTITQSQRQSMENLLYHLPPDASPWGKLYDRKLFEHLRYPEGMIFEDTYLIADLIAEAGDITFGDQPMYHYRFHENTLSKGSLPENKMDYLDSVEHLTSVVLNFYPDLMAGCTRRSVHAALSTRRLLVDCEIKNDAFRERCERMIRENAWSVLKNKRAPLRDKAGVLLTLAGPRVFDFAWKFYQKRRKDY